ncbi:MAG: hypothetical protein IKX16_04105 [Clostridia bacterium]|nr:hypothetical protein [Clostridia bacterium]
MKKIAILLTLCFVIMLVPASSFAASYEECSHPMFGWGISVSASGNQKTGDKKWVGGIDNRASSLPANYSRTHNFNHTIALTGTLKNKLSGELNISTGAITGGLAAEIDNSYSISNSFVSSYSECYSTTVPAHMNLDLYSQPYGVKLTVYAIWHTAWIHGERIKGTIGIPQLQKFVPITSRTGGGSGNVPTPLSELYDNSGK